MEKVGASGCTAMLRVHYFKIVNIMHHFIRARRSGDEKLHLCLTCTLVTTFVM